MCCVFECAKSFLEGRCQELSRQWVLWGDGQNWPQGPSYQAVGSHVLNCYITSEEGSSAFMPILKMGETEKE